MRSRVAASVFCAIWLACIVPPISSAATSQQGSQQATQQAYAGAEACAECHQALHGKWRQSDHYQSMRVADSTTVLGNFGDVTVEFHGIRNRLFVRDGKFFVNTMASDGNYRDFQILHTFGYEPLQQYLVATDRGRLQALNVAWDARDEAAGGQRWFHLQPDESMSPDNPLFWGGFFSTWNNRCADCHSTGLRKGYDIESDRYNTTWAEINVACESCHGPGKAHVASRGATGFKAAAPALDWVFEKGQVIASPVGIATDHEIDTCGGCHSRRSAVSAPGGDATYHQQYALQTLGEGLYHADGQIDDEVFVLGSFLQSKMYGAGVTCSNCHDPHTGKTKVPGNALCGQCHLPAEFDAPSHHHHKTNSEGALCVNCHMPSKTYMQVDDRRDHSFLVPRPLASEVTGSPNACVTCHKDKPLGWVQTAFNSWGISQSEDHWSTVNYRSRQLDISTVTEIGQLSQDEDLSDIVRATLLEQLAAFPSEVSVNIASIGLADPSSLVRRSAVSALAAAPPGVLWQLLSPLINDVAKPVRMEAVRVLLPVYGELRRQDQQRLSAAVAEYREYVGLEADSPAGLLSLASLEQALGNRGAALSAFQRSLAIAPGYVPALMNLADHYRSMGQDSRARPLLLKALRVAPDSAAANHSYGLFLIRAGQHAQALSYLANATRGVDSSPRFAYVYSIALDSLGQTGDAIAVLRDASETWPNQYDLLLTQVIFLEKSGRNGEIAGPLMRLQAIAPASPDVQRLMQRYAM
jgi:Flp pilus assembly protein TadD